MSEAISQQRLDDIDDICYIRDCKDDDHRAIHDLRAEVDRLTTALAEADAREKSVRDRREQTARALGETQFDRDQARARVAELEGERDEARDFARLMRRYVDPWTRDSDFCETFDLEEVPAWFDDDTAAAPDRSDGSRQ